MRTEQRTRTIQLAGKPSDDRIRELRDSIQAFTDAGDYLAALNASRVTTQGVREKHGEQHTEYAVSLGNGARIYTELGDYAKAEQLYSQADAIFQRQNANGDLDYARNLHNLGVLYVKQRKDDEARPLVERELLLFLQANATETTDYAQSIGTLGEIHFGLSNPVEAEQRFTQALQILERVADKQHQIYLDNLNNLGFVSISLGKLEQADKALNQSYDDRKRLYGDEHDDFAESSHNLAVLHEVRNEPEKANQLFRQSLDITWSNLEKASLTQSHRQQIAAGAAFRRRLDSYLAFTVRNHQFDIESVYEQTLRWKGAAFTRRQHLIQGLQDEQITQLAQKLRSTSADLASLALRIPTGEDRFAWKSNVRKLADQKEEFEQRLFARYATVRQKTPPTVTVDLIQQKLPIDGSLVDIIQYRNVSWGKSGTGDRKAKQHLTAFIVPKSGDVRRVDLGPADAIDNAVMRWRKNFGLLDEQSTETAGDQLRRLVWEPIEKELSSGAVFIAPDGALTLFPFAALPGNAPGSYLIRERAVATVPVPQVLPYLTASDPGVDAGDLSLLVVGDVQYTEAPAPDGSRSSVVETPANGIPFRNWPPLGKTFVEMTSVRGLFERAFYDGTCRILQGRRASETFFRDEAPGNRWLHIATHGFFAESLRPQLLSGDNIDTQANWDLALFPPDVLAGIVFAGANDKRRGQQDDGLLTALEVAQMDLASVDMAVLSACETGLGDLREGEGVLSLQRAFHVAGAKSVISSLWKVNDRWTKELMEDFYTNLWDKKMSKMEALQAAQIAMLDEGASRGLEPLLDNQPHDMEKRLPPYYWAAFLY